MATLKQVAERAGVSRRTVDRVLNQRGAVKPETAQRVRAALRELDYRPDETGQTLAAKKRKIHLAFCYIKSETAVFHQMIWRGAVEKAKDLGKLGIMVDFYGMDRDHPLSSEQADELVENFSCDGMAVVGQENPILQRMIDKAYGLGIPVIFYNIDDERYEKSCYVGCDYRKAGRMAAGLLGLCGGVSKVGVFTVGGSVLAMQSPNYKERFEGFSREIGEHYPQIEIVGQYLLPRDILDCYETMREVLTREKEMDAVYLVNPGNYGACRAIKKITGSRKVKIVTNDLTKEAVSLLEEGVLAATISQDPESQGKLPLQLLFEKLVFGREPRERKHYTDLQIFIPQSLP